MIFLEKKNVEGSFQYKNLYFIKKKFNGEHDSTSFNFKKEKKKRKSLIALMSDTVIKKNAFINGWYGDNNLYH